MRLTRMKMQKRNIPDDDRVLFVPHNFRYLKKFLQLNGIKEVDGGDKRCIIVLLDNNLRNFA